SCHCLAIKDTTISKTGKRKKGRDDAKNASPLPKTSPVFSWPETLFPRLELTLTRLISAPVIPFKKARPLHDDP
ncbi:MAG: hypothetical protein VXV93_04630, partial [Pseudomonadota bacterium]|nr:hypothetical protein [Pseudomonadota bacterium]